MSDFRPFALATATWPEVAPAPRRALLVPLGSLEQHGPHLPLGTDTRIAEAVAWRVAAPRPDVAVAPALSYGSSGEHAGFAGTLSIGTEALVHLLVELGRDAARDWSAMLLVNAHGGNRDAVSRAVAQLTAEDRRCAAFWAAPADGDLHAGHTETALLLHLEPGLVRPELARAGDPRPWPALAGELRRSGVRAVSGNGVLGDPADATAEEGRRLLDELAAGCTAALDALIRHD